MTKSFLFFIIAAVNLRTTVQTNIVLQNHMPIDLFPLFINLRFFTQYAVFTLALLPLADIWCMQKRFYEYLRAPLFLLAGSWWALIFLNGSRGLILSFIVSSAIGLLIFKKTLLPWLWRQGVFIFLGFCFVLLFHISSVSKNAFTFITHIVNYHQSALETRIKLYQYAFHLIKQHPLFGVGPMHFALQPPPFLIKAHSIAAHPHNVVLLIFSEWGMLAGIAISIFAILTVWRFIQSARIVKGKNGDGDFMIIYASFAMSLFAGLLDALVSGIFVMPLSQLMFAMISGSCLALYLQANPVSFESTVLSTKQRFFYNLILIAVTVYSLLFVGLNVIHALPNLSVNEQCVLNKNGVYSRFSPRFWAQGWINVSCQRSLR